MKKIAILIFSVLLLGACMSCTDWLDVNKNVDAPDRVAPELRLPGIIASYYDSGLAYDMFAVGPLAQYCTSSSASPNNFGLHSYPIASDSYSEVWRMTYWLQGQNLEDLINDSEAAQQYTMAGIGYAIKAYSWHTLASLHGDIPMKDAFVPGLQSHSYDSQDVVYKQVRAWAYKSISYLEKADQTAYGTKLTSSDYIYKGDKTKWKKLAYAVLARNYIAMSNKPSFNADSVIYCVDHSFASTADEPKVQMDGNTSVSVTCNFFGVTRPNLSNSFFASDWAVQVLTGRIPFYAPDGGKTSQLLSPQIIADTTKAVGTYDPRVACLLGTTSAKNLAGIQDYKYVGGRPGAGTGGGGANYFGLNVSVSVSNSGTGRWLYRDDAPWPLSSYAEMQLIKAEAAWRKGDKAMALAAFKEGVKAAMDFCESYISTSIAEKIDKATFRTYANQYLAGPYVGQLTTSTLTLSHIMMQKWVALYMWGLESFNDIRRYHYDLKLGGSGVPEPGISYDTERAYHKDQDAPDRIYKGYFLPSADVQDRRIKLPVDNAGAPCYRIRPRYNSEYMWNKPSLEALQPIPGTAKNYQCSMIWFANPNN